MRHRLVVLTLAVVTLGLTQTASGNFSTRTTYNFTGTCSDCSGTATATLTLGDYTLGQAITTSNLINFTYNGTNLTSAFTISGGDPGAAASGSITTIPGQNTVFISNNSNGFTSNTNGRWTVGLADFGTTSTWTAASPTATPAPSTIVLLTLGLLAMAALFWWQRRTA